MLRKGWRHLSKFHGTVASELRRAFSDDAVRSALSGALLHNGVPAERMPVSAILGLVAQICEGFYLPERGMGQVPQVLSCALQKRGTTVFFNSEVEKIIVENNHVRGGVIKGSGQLDTPAVISTTSGMLTFGSLIDAKHVPSRIAPKLQRPRLSHRAVSIQLGLTNKIAAPAHSVSVLPWMEHQQDLFFQDGSEMKFPVYLVPTLTMPELAPEGTPMRWIPRASIVDVRVSTLFAQLCVTSLLRCCPPNISSIMANHDELCELPGDPGGPDPQKLSQKSSSPHGPARHLANRYG